MQTMLARLGHAVEPLAATLRVELSDHIGSGGEVGRHGDVRPHIAARGAIGFRETETGPMVDDG